MTLDLAAIEAARERIRGVARHTPLLPSRYWSEVASTEVHLKAECLQRTGSFKIRGATNMIALLTAEERERGVIAASAGNHAQGVAVAARAAGVAATVVMPRAAVLAKVEATRGYGAEVILAGDSFAEAVAAMEELAAERGLTIVPAFDDERIIAGQGTLGLELLDDLPDLDVVLVPVGGGGLAAGVALAIKAQRPTVRVIGVQAAAAPAAAHSFYSNAVTTVATARTIADGIAIARPGSVTVPLLRRWLDDVVTVGEEAVSQAMVDLLERAKLVVEGAGAVGAAALLSGAVQVAGQQVAVVLSGGNVDMNLIGRTVEHGLFHAGRYLVVRVVIDDQPGRLAALLGVVAGAGANVLDVEHHRAGSRVPVGFVEVELLLETRGAEHGEQIAAALETAGYREDALLERRSIVRVFAIPAARPAAD